MRTLTLVLVLTSGTLAQSQPASSLDAARELYASADYRGALEMLDRLAAADSTRTDRPSIDLYRAFCLIALERAGEADEAIVAMITRDPLYRPADAEVPPRLRPVFSDKRRVVLPGVIQTRYERAKTAYEKSDYKEGSGGQSHDAGPRGRGRGRARTSTPVAGSHGGFARRRAEARSDLRQ